MHEMQENRSLPREENLVKLEEPCRTNLRERRDCLGEKTEINRERNRENDRRIARGA